MTSSAQIQVELALQRIEEAQRLLELAAEDLCSVPGLASEWQRLVKLRATVNRAWHQLDARHGRAVQP